MAAVVFGACGAGHAASAPPIAPADLILPDGFTLEYTAVAKDVRTPAAKAAQLKIMRDNLEKQVGGHKMTQAQADKMIAMNESAMSKSIPKMSLRMTLSAAGGKLCCREATSGTRMSGLSSTLVYDGQASLRYSPRGVSMLTPGCYFGYGLPAPMPGLGVAGMPLITSPVTAGVDPSGVQTITGKVPTLNMGQGDPASGKLMLKMVDGLPQMQSMTTLFRGSPRIETVYPTHQLFNGHWIASSMLFTLLSEFGPLVDIDFKLNRAVGSPVTADRFTFEHWLQKGDRVQCMTPGHFASFPYDPAAGSVMAQAQAASARQDAMNLRLQQQLSRSANSPQAFANSRRMWPPPVLDGHPYRKYRYVCAALALVLLAGAVRYWRARRPTPVHGESMNGV
jgi:hypothetical protein